MSGYLYFNYDRMTLLEVKVHSDDLDCFIKPQMSMTGKPSKRR